MPPTTKQAGQRGLAVDSHGEPVVDPTKNVLDLVQNSIERLDDLRAADQLLVVAKLQIMEAKVIALGDMQRLRAEHSSEITQLESKRLDAIRAVDVAAVQTAADRAAQAITALAATTTTNAENLRNALTTTATTIAKQTADTVAGITERLTSLERSSYVGQGKAGVIDPAAAANAELLQRLLIAQSAGAGKSQGQDNTWKVVASVIGVIATLVGIYAVVKP